MGEVYLARDTQLDRDIAIKVLTADMARDQQRLHRFLQEARAASALSHPNAAHIYEIGEIDGAQFIAMEFVEGESLDHHIGAQPLAISTLLDIATQIADALDEAHAKGITHRDIKSSNIVISSRGRVKVLDFGLAKISASAAVTDRTSNSELATRVKTSPGMVMGTVNYMSPEQALGREVDHRTDIFSFGVVLYEMATGRLPFTGDTVTETIDRIAHAQPEAIARLNYEVPPDLEIIIKKALRKDRDERYQTIHDVLVDLRDLKRERDLAASLERSTPPASRSVEIPTQGSSSQFEKTGIIAPSPTGSISSAPRTSSAEYVVGQLKSNKRTVILAVAGILVMVGVVVAGASFALWKYHLQKTSQAGKSSTGSSNLKITRLTTNGKTQNAAISPDGKTVVYVIKEGSKRSLWIRQVATSSNVQIVPPVEMNIGRQTFSPDGNYVYYRASDKENPTGALYQVPALGGTPRKILSNIASPISFSPDGRRIAFIRDESVINGEMQLITANNDGANERKLIGLKGDRFFDNGGPSWSPDGKVIASGAGTYTGGFHLTVVTIDAETGAEKRMTTKKFDSAGRVSWLADGRGVLVNATEQGSNQSQIWMIHHPSGEAERITRDLVDYGGTSLTADSNALVTVQFESSSNVWVAPINDLTGGKQVTSGKLDGDRGLSWTNDNKIVYTSLASGNVDLWIMDADGANQRQLTFDPQMDDTPRISPDGRYLFFDSLRGGLPSIWRMNIDGSNLKQITTQEDYVNDVTPDGQWLVFTSWRTGRQTLWKVGIDGGEPVQISNLFITTSAISPDGKFLACFYQDEKPNAPLRLIILPFAGGEPVKTFDMPQTAGGRPDWTPDGKAITFYDNRTGTLNLWSQPLDGGPLKQLTNFSPHELFSRDFTRDGKLAALARGPVTSDVILISDFR
jgi:serine/threonine protein kinase